MFVSEGKDYLEFYNVSGGLVIERIYDGIRLSVNRPDIALRMVANLKKMICKK